MSNMNATNTTTITLDFQQQAIVVRGLTNRISLLFPMRHDMSGKLDNWMVEQIRSTIKLIRLAKKCSMIQFSL